MTRRAPRPELGADERAVVALVRTLPELDAVHHGALAVAGDRPPNGKPKADPWKGHCGGMHCGNVAVGSVVLTGCQCSCETCEQAPPRTRARLPEPLRGPAKASASGHGRNSGRTKRREVR